MPKVKNTETDLKEKISSIIDEIEILIGYSNSDVSGRTNPFFIKDSKEIENLVFNKFCINNLAVYPYYMAKDTKGKIGIILKPCDARSIVQLISEELLDRQKIKAIVIGCNGVIDVKKLKKQIGGSRIISIDEDGKNIKISTMDENFSFKVSDFYADKCYGCTIYDNPPYFDEYIENTEKLIIPTGDRTGLLEKLENDKMEEIVKFWEKEFSRCIRCYACRNICPLEICRDRCIAQVESPHWQSKKINSEEGKFFQLIRVFHLAGRCTECGECERACPANIPLVTLMKKVNRDILRLFDFTPGMDIDEKPPLLTFKDVEKNIKEEELI